VIPVELGDGRLLLRAPTWADAADIARICRDPEIPRWIGSIPLDYTVDDARWFLTQMVEPGWESGHSLVWLITDRTTGDPYGTVGLHQREQGVAEVGFLLAAWARGRGYMTDAVQLVCEYGFGALGLSRIEWQAVVGNVASRAVAQRTGFTFEGVLRGRLQQHDGSGSGERVAADAWIAARLAPTAPAAVADPDVVLREGAVELRPWRRDDADDLVRARQDPLLQVTFDDPVPYTHTDAEDFLASRPAAWAAGCPSFAVVESASQRLLGLCEVLEANSYEGPEVGYWLASWARGKGYAEPALRAMCRWLFRAGAPRIRWDAQVGNLASLRTAEAVGFVVEGVQRAAFVGKDGRHDKWTGSLLPADLREHSAEPLRESHLLRRWSVEPVRLATSRLALRGLLPTDADWMWELAGDPDTRQWSPMAPTTLDATRDFVRARASWGAGRSTWAATLADGTPVGLISLHEVSVENLSAEVGYRVLPAHRGHGYSAEAVTAVTTWAFDALDLQRVTLLHASGNAASCRVAERAGFALEGRTRRSYRYGDGELHDEHVHARLATD